VPPYYLEKPSVFCRTEDILRLIRQPVAEPGPGEVLLEVRAAGVNPADWKGYSGQMGNDPKALAMRLGREASGVVAAVGPGAEGPPERCPWVTR
jgi:NADPH:quinone reductase